MTGHDRWADAAGAYVLGAMAPEEREAFESHLATCSTCQGDVDELRPAAAALPMASPPMLPPPELKDRIMAEVEREAALLAQAGPAADRPAPGPAPRTRRRRLPPLGFWRLAPVAAAFLIVGVLVGSQVGGGSKDISFDRAGAELELDGDQATLVADNVPPPPEGRVYEVWIQPKGADAPQPTNALFVPRSDGSAVAAIPGGVSDGDKVMVTDEPRGGSDTPTGKLLMSAEIS
jgi:anti-sigma-K factor RskA